MPGQASAQSAVVETTLASYSPFDGARLGTVELTAPEAVQGVVDSVAAVQPAWAELSIRERADRMRGCAQVIVDDLDRIATLLTREQGKPRNESYTMEVIPTIDLLHWVAANAEKIIADEKVANPQPFLWHKRSWFSYEPIGVVGVISPWNYPWSIPFGEVAIALACGNGVVLKPAPLTPLIGQEIQGVFERAGLPSGLVRCVHGDGAVGQALVQASVSKIFFTGSVEVGRQVAMDCAQQLKGSVLELGGKDPQLVLSDADLSNAVSGALWAGFANAGQTCAGIERVYVAREIAQAFTERLVAEAADLSVGDPLDPTIEVGPMVSPSQYSTVCELIDDALAQGATLRCGGPVQVEGTDGSFIAPTVLTDVTPQMRIMREEIFGPVLPVIAVDSEAEAIALANDSEFGLGASVWTSDRRRGSAIADRLNTGMVWLNDHMYSHGAAQCSWGGTKNSGLGRAHSKFGFYECVNIKQLSWQPARIGAFWWYPYDDSLARGLNAAARLLYGPMAQKPKALIEGAPDLARLAGRIARGLWRRG